MKMKAINRQTARQKKTCGVKAEADLTDQEQIVEATLDRLINTVKYTQPANSYFEQ